MPIETCETTPEQQAADRAYYLRMADRVHLANYRLPTADTLRLYRNPEGGYELTGDLAIFGIADGWCCGLPIAATDDADAVRQAWELIRARWEREGRRADTEAEAAALSAA